MIRQTSTSCRLVVSLGLAKGKEPQELTESLWETHCQVWPLFTAPKRYTAKDRSYRPALCVNMFKPLLLERGSFNTFVSTQIHNSSKLQSKHGVFTAEQRHPCGRSNQWSANVICSSASVTITSHMSVSQNSGPPFTCYLKGHQTDTQRF